jgi:hypothetical protein
MKAHDRIDAPAGYPTGDVGRETLPGLGRRIGLPAGRTAPLMVEDSFPCRRSA